MWETSNATLVTNCYIIALVDKLPTSKSECKENQLKAEITIIKYLENEGFIGKEHIYVGMQKFEFGTEAKGFIEGGSEA